MKNKKLGFFSRVKIAVMKLENYAIFLEEKTSNAVKYFFLIVLILSVVMAIVEAYSTKKFIDKGYKYIKNELPDFSYQDNILNFSERVHSYDEELDIYMIADTSEQLSDERIQEYKDEIKSVGIIFLKDKAIYKNGGDSVEYLYNRMSEESGIGQIDRNMLIKKIESVGILGILVTICFAMIISLFVFQVVSTFLDWVLISLVALISARIYRMNMSFKHMFNISIYALTLSIILTMVYNIAYYLADFYTEYFRLVYFLIAYVYVIAAILIIKSDGIKQQIEVTKVVEKQKEIHDKLEDKEENEETKDSDETPEKDAEDDDDGEELEEPDGSEI